MMSRKISGTESNTVFFLININGHFNLTTQQWLKMDKYSRFLESHKVEVLRTGGFILYHQ